MQLERRYDFVIKLVLLGIFLVSSSTLSAQTFFGTEWSVLKNLAEYESQRYLMSEIIELSNEKTGKLQLEKVFQDYDSDGGFIFLMTSYVYENKSGVVITSMARGAIVTEPMTFFRHLHLSTKELNDLNTLLEEMGETAVDVNSSKTRWGVPETQHLRVFNKRLIVDIDIDPNFFTPDYSFWIDIQNRHQMTYKSWKKAFKRHNQRAN